MTPLVAAGAKEPSRTASLLVHLLLLKGARLPSVDDSSEWVGQVRSWAIEIIEGGRTGESAEEQEAQTLLDSSFDDVDQWCRDNLPAPSTQVDQSDLYGGYASDDDGGRAASVPLEFARGRSPLFRRETTFDTGTGPSASRASSPADVRREASEPVKPTRGQPEVLDLTDDRSPSPVPKEEEVEASLRGAPPSPPSARAQGKKRAASRSRSRSPGRNERRPAPRAHLRVDNLPDGFTGEQLMECFADVPGVLDAEVHQSQMGALWGFVSLASLATAQHAFATKNGTYAGGSAADDGARPLGLKIYSVDGTPVEPQRQVEPVNNLSGAMPGAMPPPPVNGAGAWPGGGAFGNFRPGANNPYPRGRFLAPGERPRVPYIFTAAELARRVYCGSLRFDISYDEVANLFSEKAGVVARVLKVMNAHDNSHSFAFVQLPDAITAEHAIKVLHGSMHEGHLLQIEHVNELNHRWLFSLSLHGLPAHWRYQNGASCVSSSAPSSQRNAHSPPL